MVRSMFAAVAGLRAHQSKMDVIGNNIANVNTYSYKKMRATFSEQFYSTLSGASDAGAVYGGTNPRQIGYGSQIGSIDVDTGRGSVAATDRGMDVMITGNGYFLVGGYNKDGFDISSTSDGNNLKSLNLTRVGIFGFDGLGNLVDVNGNHVYGFVNQDMNGSKPVYGKPLDPANPNDLTQKLEALKIPQVVSDKNGKVATYTETTTVDGKTEKVEKVSIPYIDETTGDTMIPYGDPPVPTKVDFTTAGGPFTGGSYTNMKVDNLTIGSDGTVSGVTTVNDKDQVVVFGKIAVANVPNPNALEATNNSYYKAKDNTGVITAETPGEGATGQLDTGKLEMSNVDLSLEMTDMITTQRGFQANSRIITVTDTMLEELVNLKR